MTGASTDAMERIVIVGASLAGLRAAEALRSHGFGGSITLVGAERHQPYDRPPLSKQVLTGKTTSEGIALSLPQDGGIDLLLGRQAEALDLAARTVVLAGGGELRFDGLVIATGAKPRILTVAPPGPGVHYLRTIDDALALRQDLLGARSLCVIGAGFIGLEVASSARAMGIDVTVLEALPVPLERALGPEMGRAVMEWHLGKGLDLRTGVGVEGLVRGDGAVAGETRPGPAGVRLAGPGPAGVRLGDGTVVGADVVAIGIGVAPDTDWLAGSGVDLADGVHADSRLRVLAGGNPVPGVVAAGDVVRWHHPDYGETVRVEHWTHATESGEAAARTLLAGDGAEPYRPVPYFWSDQHGVKLQFVGRTAAGDEVETIEGSFAEDRVLVAFGRDGRLVGALGMRRPARVMALQRLIGEGAAFPPEM